MATETAISHYLVTSVAATLTAIARQEPEVTMMPQPNQLYEKSDGCEGDQEGIAIVGLQQTLAYFVLS